MTQNIRNKVPILCGGTHNSISSIIQVSHETRVSELENEMIRHWRICLLVLALYGSCTAAQTGRGELLYETYCNNCHTVQLHWRATQVATNWASLVAEVRRWQANGNLDWSGDDIEAVARYLNILHYHYPLPGK